MDVYLEFGRRRLFAGALEWPGWCRAGRDEDAALRALVAYGDRYRTAIGDPAGRLRPPSGVAELRVVERLAGGPTTDFGAPGEIPTFDHQPPDDAELDFFAAVLSACWAAFDRAAESTAGRTLAPAGPRGGGRSVERIREHVMAADAGYGRSLGARMPDGDWPAIRSTLLEALPARARGELPERGPRGGLRWPARYAARRAAWHVLDHAWEIEDRLAAAAGTEAGQAAGGVAVGPHSAAGFHVK